MALLLEMLIPCLCCLSWMSYNISHCALIFTRRESSKTRPHSITLSQPWGKQTLHFIRLRGCRSTHLKLHLQLSAYKMCLYQFEHPARLFYNNDVTRCCMQLSVQCCQIFSSVKMNLAVSAEEGPFKIWSESRPDSVTSYKNTFN